MWIYLIQEILILLFYRNLFKATGNVLSKMKNVVLMQCNLMTEKAKEESYHLA